MPTFGIAEIKRVILQCKKCNHDTPIHQNSVSEVLMIPSQCANPNCREVWLHPAVGFPIVTYQVSSTWDVQAYCMFLSLLPSIRVAEARAVENATEKIVPFRIRFEFADPST